MSSFRLYQAFIARREKVYIWAIVLDVVLTFARNGIAYLILIGMVLNNGMSALAFLLYFSATGGFADWVSGIFSGFSTLYRQSLDLSSVREFLEYPEPFMFENGESLEPMPGNPYEIELRNVTFRYPKAEKDTLEYINLKIKPNEKLAVVGLNGAGKTTLVKLICGFYDPTSGEVLLNGENIKKYNRRDYYKHFSAVFQDFSLLATTIAGNIAQDNECIDEDKAESCAERAGLSTKVETLPNKLETYIGKEVYEEGVEFSGGETQRLMLARALYKDAPIIVLDEPTAALDPIAESDVYNRYNELTGGRTSVYISHRPASTRFCDRIILIDKNAIAEEGTHDSLIEKGGKYAELFEIQSRYYREGALEYGEECEAV
ncbi:MAG: ABC transporter ATP-binding protein/permease [Firmicutes bacterium]|nr:ABC transporter ATP-binding protein/permease [Bacillota bacterium]